MKNLLGVLGVFAVSVIPLGCGSSSDNNIVGGPSCTVGACGGDIVGTWTLTTVCADKSVFMEAFVGGLMGQWPGANVGAVNFTPSGSLMFNADMSYMTTIGVSGSLVINVPSSCLNGATCADLAAAFTGDPTIQSVVCSGTSTCACTIEMTPDQPTSESGTYTISGSTVLTTPTGATAADSQAYCVKGTTVTFPATAADRMSSGIVALVGTKS